MAKAKRAADGEGNAYVRIHCPGCDSEHMCRVSGEGRPRWGFNGNFDAPTLTPSILVTYNGPDAGQLDEDGDRAPPAVCHSYVTDGKIEFLGDSTHALAGQTVPLPDLETLAE